MAKKVVATLKKEGTAKFVKIIKAIKKENGAYAFKEEMVPESDAKNILAQKS